MPNILPDLELLCDRCNGEKLVVTYRGEERCHKCQGTGYVPTEIGQQILSLVYHSLQPAVSPIEDCVNQSDGCWGKPT